MSASKRITLLGGALAKNVFWQVAGRTTIAAGAHFEGVLLCKTDVTLELRRRQKGALALHGRCVRRRTIEIFFPRVLAKQAEKAHIQFVQSR
jgi:nucleoside recognition membrane protein YjiH